MRTLVTTVLLVVVGSATPLHAQWPALLVTGRAGLGIPSDNYQAACGGVSAAYTVDVQGRGRVFPHLSLDRFAGSGGAEVACIPTEFSAGAVRGGVQVDGATRVAIGAGLRLGGARIQLEGSVLGGAMFGQYGFLSPGAQSAQTRVPHMGGQLALVVYRYIVLSASAHWTRIAIELTPPEGQPFNTRSSWSPMSTMQVGVRIPLDRR